MKLYFGWDVTSSTSCEFIHNFIAIDVVRPFGFLSVWELFHAFLQIELVPPFSEELRKVTVRVSEQVDSLATLRFGEFPILKTLVNERGTA